MEGYSWSITAHAARDKNFIGLFSYFSFYDKGNFILTKLLFVMKIRTKCIFFSPKRRVVS